ncbi:RQC-minor-1 family DNA-binding protein [Thiohalophilus sp.]|uniref:RQC-minor-1 family DNA-binding protein n=1 Tax=Thiohalophilus sp. TaxID=3028392 RepID=UPI002ACD6CB1|nr:RQC-minor-1 family DNA-binding protein [Thiohalophilus sp.]MDZ7663359.1 RQC-minor-1 family DNA-binding protein [Thiohalophilus sp.]
MSRNKRRFPVTLDARGVQSLAQDEIVLILRGADELIMRGGRTLLAKVLKGSREKKLIELELDHSPAYGALARLTMDDILTRIDWLILNDYLAIQYDGRLPLLVYTARGWAIERETYTAEMLARVDALITVTDTPPDLTWLNDINREVVLSLLARIESSGDPRYLPALEAWSRNTYKKIRQRIRSVIEKLS